MKGNDIMTARRVLMGENRRKCGIILNSLKYNTKNSREIQDHKKSTSQNLVTTADFTTIASEDLVKIDGWKSILSSAALISGSAVGAGN